MHTQTFRKFLLPFTVYLFFASRAIAADGISLYTPYTKISVPPGQSIDYTIDVKNNGSTTKNVSVSISGMPKGWTYTLKSGGWDVQQIAILPGDKKIFSLKVEVPLKVNKGNHVFRVVAGGYDVLPLTVNVSEQGTFKTEFTSEQANMQGHAKSNFSFTTKLKNFTGEKQTYSLWADAPQGWEVIFKPNYKQATAVEIDANGTVNISVDVKPPYNVQAGTYRIPVQAVNNVTSASLVLEVVIKGSYSSELTTPNGLLSARITAGREKRIELVVVNTGSSDLKNVVLGSSKPKNWDVVFKPDTLKHIIPGASAQAVATVKADDKAIPGDYVITISAQNPETSSRASFRMMVKTPLLWGWVGILLIISVIGVIYYLFRKYGRR
ncbi:MAG: hypothetical protein JXB00_10110 [Bacteroidales bacterium]|nr:hypothetical protein [Bacteroidales bacterium]